MAGSILDFLGGSTGATGAAGKAGGFLGKLGGPLSAIGVASGALKGILGLFQKGKANKMLKQLRDPGYVIPAEYTKNLAQAEQLAKSGMGAEQKNMFQQNINRGLATGTRGLSRSANPSAGVASMVRAATEGGLNMASMDEQIKRQNIREAMGFRREMAGQKLAQQQYNQNRYMNAVNQANALKGAGMQNAFGGLSDIGTIGAYSVRS